MGERQSGMLKDAESGILYMDNVQYLDGGLLRGDRLLQRKARKERAFSPVAHRTHSRHRRSFRVNFNRYYNAEDHRTTDRRTYGNDPDTFFDRSLAGRQELVVKEELMRCLLLYECPENFQQLRGISRSVVPMLM